MSRAAHNRKSGDRYPCGKLKRKTKEQMEEAQRHLEDIEKVTVLKQPHRRGERSQLAESAIGRFILSRWPEKASGRYDSSREEIYAGAMRYAACSRKYGSAWGAPSIDRLGGSGADIPMETIREWLKNVREWEAEMQSEGLHVGRMAVNMMAVHNQDYSPRAPYQPVVRALEALAVATGAKEGRRRS